MTRLLVTGARGMVGRNLVEALSDDFEVVGPARSELDLLDRTAVRKFLVDCEPAVIVHAAGRVGGIEANRNSNSDFLFDNAVMGLNLVRAAADLEVPRLLNLSSSCTYPSDRADAMAEDAILTGPLEPTNEGYAIGKIAVHRYCQLLSSEDPRRSYKTAVPCNLYGRYDTFDPVRAHMVPSALSKLARAVDQGLDSVEIWGDGTARREFMYVGDLVSFVRRALQRWESLPSTVNVGLGRDWSVAEYYKAAASVVGFDGEFTYDLTRPVGMRRKLLDCTAVNEWGWEPTHTLEEGLQKTYDYFRSL